MNRNIPGNYLKALHFENPQNPIKIEKAQGEYKIKT
jgi:preprotein translocase subunit SecB